MNDMSLKKELNPRTKAFVLITGLILLGIIVGYGISQISLQILLEEVDNLPIKIDESRITRSIDYYIGAIIILTVELVLLIGIFIVYFDSYRKTKSRFLIVLNLFIFALLVKSVLSIVSLHTVALDYIQVIPYVSRTFLTPGFGVINFVLTGIEIVAMSIFVYMSTE